MIHGNNFLKVFVLITVSIFLPSCTHFAIEDCVGKLPEDKVLGVNKVRIKSSHFRMFLEDEPAVANRFLHFASMSSLTYEENMHCEKKTDHINPDDRETFENILSNREWKEVTDIEGLSACEDDIGLFYRVWKKESDEKNQVVISFRGTDGIKDWFYGNLHWITQFLPIEDQYSAARKIMQKVFAHFGESDKPIQFFTTGHSLGGGLAQHILYSYPTKITQAIAFDPSAATGYVKQSLENQLASCECDSSDLNGEARIYRIYDAYEILANIRIFHKIFFNPERHIQEIRFPNQASHSMSGLTTYMLNQTELKDPSAYTHPWYSGRGYFNDSKKCTVAFEEAHKNSCNTKVTATGLWFMCPQGEGI